MEIKKFSVIGISVRTTNEKGQSGQDIPALWNRFISEGILQQIPDKISDDIYCLYTDYEKDHTKPYTTLLGCAVSSLNNIPEGMMGKLIETAQYTKFVASGDLAQGVVFNEWLKIWSSDLDRTFTTDFEVYNEKALHPENAEVDIYIAIQ
jgi:predicted transcriptional regulator YdeE